MHEERQHLKNPKKPSPSPSHRLYFPLFSSFNDYLNCCFFFSSSFFLQAKPIYGGWLCLAPEGTDFDNPMQRSRVRAFVVVLHVAL